MATFFKTDGFLGRVLIGGGKWAVDDVIARRLEQGERVPQQPMRKVAQGLRLFSGTIGVALK